MVYDVVMGDIVEEEAALPAEEGAIDGSGRATLVTPSAAAVVRDIRVCVVEVGDHDEPVCDGEPGYEVELGDGGEAVEGACVGDAADHGEDADVGDDDGVALAFGEEDRVGCVGARGEVVRTEE